ncbi:MAG: Ig-like domain-containing protein [Candidatus Symbiothrix sp.]|jgi:hypothetical protein|nr:Ig-like domain-containing protein [Candidatus Symbiothrix sp.]
MKKILVLFVTCFLVIGNCSLVTAQVAIGGDGTVATGAVLDLSQQGAASGGLLLPQVVLTAENANPFGEGESTTLSSGLLVYNLGSETEGAALDEGLYVLQAGLWKPAGSGSSGGGIPVVNISITPNTPFSLGVGNTAPMDFSTYPPNATYPSMSWNSSDTDIATISNLGVVTGVAPGNTNISLTLGSVTSDPVAVTVVTCGSPFTAPSGKVYNTAAYNNTNLTNLCWTTSNLQEAGYSATCYSNNCGTYPTSGYYYTFGSAGSACSALNNGEHVWRLPTTAEWSALSTALPNLVSKYPGSIPEHWNLTAWVGDLGIAGIYLNNGSWLNPTVTYWFRSTNDGDIESAATLVDRFYFRALENWLFMQVRCVRSL